MTSIEGSWGQEEVEVKQGPVLEGGRRRAAQGPTSAEVRGVERVGG